MATKEEIIEYVMNSPQNTNRSVLNSMLEHIANTDELSPEKYDGATEGLHHGEGDVTIYYGETLLGSLSENGSATLQIEGEVSETDIRIEYVKPEVPMYSITYDPRAIQPETGAPGAPTSATAGSRVSVTYNIGTTSTTAELMIDVAPVDGSGNRIPYTASITGSGSNHILELVWYMPAAPVDVVVDRSK